MIKLRVLVGLVSLCVNITHAMGNNMRGNNTQKDRVRADRVAVQNNTRGSKARASHRVQKRPKAQVRRNFWDRCIACFCCDSCSESEAELEAGRRRRLAQQKALQKRRARPQPESHLFNDAGLVLAIM